MAYPDTQFDPDDDVVTVPDVDRSDGVDDPDDQGEEDRERPATSLYDDNARPVAPGEIRTDKFGNVTVGAVAARASSDVHLPQ